MFNNTYNFAFIGGDMRQIYMINELLSLHYSVVVYGLSDPLLDDRCVIVSSLKDAVMSSNILILPIPIMKDSSRIVSKANIDIDFNEFKSYLTLDHKLYGGVFSKDFKEYLTTNNIYYHDFMEQEDVVLYNSIATAEGTIACAITNSTINLHDSSCLILGYGRCGITLAHKLKLLSKNVTISARSKEQLASAHTSLFNTIPLNDLDQNIQEFDFIFNTIPSIVLTKDLLIMTKPSVVIIDIASNPGGVDLGYAKEINRYANLYHGIPGKVSPKSSATFLNNHILNQFRKK